MPRNLSVALTREAVEARRKTVTRRLGWAFAKPGDRLNLVNKAMGFRKGEKPIRYASVEVVSVRREPLNAITSEDVVREGFEGQTPAEFVAFFCKHMKCTPDTWVTRIEFEYLNEEQAA